MLLKIWFLPLCRADVNYARGTSFHRISSLGNAEWSPLLGPTEALEMLYEIAATSDSGLSCKEDSLKPRPAISQINAAVGRSAIVRRMCYGTLLAHAVMATVRIIFVIGVGIFLVREWAFLIMGSGPLRCLLNLNLGLATLCALQCDHYNTFDLSLRFKPPKCYSPHLLNWRLHYGLRSRRRRRWRWRW